MSMALTMMAVPWSPPNPPLSPHPPRHRRPGANFRAWARVGLGLLAFALAGTVLAVLPYFGVGPDTSPTADTYLERRYGNIGIGLAAFWLIAMAVAFVVGIVLTLCSAIGQRRSKPG